MKVEKFVSTSSHWFWRCRSGRAALALVSGGTAAAASGGQAAAPIAGQPSLRDFLQPGVRTGNAAARREVQTGAQLYAKAIHAIAETHIKLVDPAQRQAFLKEWEHKFD